MKVIITMSVLLFLCLSSIAGPSENGNQNRKDTLKYKVADRCAIHKDSITNYSININGKLNAVSINNDNSTDKNIEKVGKPKNAANTVEINGEGNSVTINQNNKGGSVNIQQNGTGNQVNVSQSNRSTVK